MATTLIAIQLIANVTRTIVTLEFIDGHHYVVATAIDAGVTPGLLHARLTNAGADISGGSIRGYTRSGNALIRFPV